MPGLIVTEVLPSSKAGCAGILPGDNIITINGNIIEDIIDYLYYQYDEVLELEILSHAVAKRVVIHNNHGEDIGLIFENGLGKKRRCINHCPFCFVDQLPGGMRESLYFKDDDWRLSFLTGSYITLTNTTESDLQRIIDKHISPLYISVHAWDNKVREIMFGTPLAKLTIDKLRRLIKNGIIINAQTVLCPGLNDGEILCETIKNLMELYPGVNSLAVVPVGLTKFRNNLTSLHNVDKITAQKNLRIIETYQRIAFNNFGKRFVYAADELYLKAGSEMPDLYEYDGLDQLENGVGLIALFKDQVIKALKKLKGKKAANKSFAIATGVDFYPFMLEIIKIITSTLGVIIRVYPVKNEFFGSNITVSGLMTGRDIVNALIGSVKEDILLIPSTCLKDGEDMLLDNMTLQDIGNRLNIKCISVEPTGNALVNQIISA